MKHSFHILIILFPLLSYSQPVKQLTIGDTVPAFVLNNTIIHFNNDSAKLSTISSKLLILDFWATWCTSCLQGFPKLETLQQQFKQDLQVVLVNSKSTGDDAKKISNFFTKHKKSKGRSYSFPRIIEDTMFTRLFAHTMIPHYVWMQQGRVKAITSAEEITAANISAIINGRPVTLKTKTDILNYNRNAPLFINNNAGSGENILARSLFAGYLQGISSGGALNKDSGNRISRLCIINKSIVDLYRQAWQFHLPASRLLLPAEDLDKLTITDWDTEKQDKLYCYEIMLPPTGKDSVYHRMQQDLQNFFGYTAAVQKTKTKCLVLQCSTTNIKSTKKKNAKNNSASPGESVFIQHQSLAVLVAHIGYSLPLPVIDETGHTGPVSIQLPKNSSDHTLLNTVLSQQGFELTEQYREIEMFVLTKK
ncbi:MAG TPA: TlpA disulfide reductase family protein [Chitinophagaceae bacterium]|nr:TlpA disulfide reductase family protein [Chitinophagaceae bacterium]